MNKQKLIRKYEDACFATVPVDEVLEDLRQLYEPQKPVVQQYVADWYEVHKNNLNEDIWAYLTSWADTKWDKFKYWMYHAGKNEAITTLVNMHKFGYEVEKETKYTVRIKVTNQYLCNDDGILYFSPGFRMDFTKNDLEKLNLGWVFDCKGIEVKKVEG